METDPFWICEGDSEMTYLMVWCKQRPIGISAIVVITVRVRSHQILPLCYEVKSRALETLLTEKTTLKQKLPSLRKWEDQLKNRVQTPSRVFFRRFVSKPIVQKSVSFKWQTAKMQCDPLHERYGAEIPRGENTLEEIRYILTVRPSALIVNLLQ